MLKIREPDISNTSYSKLLRGFIVGAVACSVLPLFLLGWVSFLNYSQFSTSTMADYYKNAVVDNRKIVELFLDDRMSDIRVVASTHSFEFLSDSSNLGKILKVLNQSVPHFTDIGLINSDGTHVAYVGPYNLSDANYSETSWFKEVQSRGGYISNVLMGFRKIPHFFIAVSRSEGEASWTLRATINSEFLSSLMKMARAGKTGEVFLVNREGIYQTSPRLDGMIMGKASLPMNLFKGESGILISDVNTPSNSFSVDSNIPVIYRLRATLAPPHSQQIIAFSRIRATDWFVVAKQDFMEFFGDIDHLNMVILILLHVSILAILIVSSLTARYMIKLIERRDKEAEKLNSQLLRARKLASVGELAAGVAHEINNPLAVILTESMVMRELTADENEISQSFREDLFNSLSQIDGQIQRCAHITQNLLNFSRRISSASEFVNVNAVLGDVVGFVEKKAHSSNVKISLNLQQNLPELKMDRFELEQVFINLINNAIDANEGTQSGSVNIISRLDVVRKGVVVSVTDTGSGISDENLERLFDPFFTTKPPGKGTGLGLSISYSIVKHMGGDISAHSEIGKGSVFSVFFPFPTNEHRHATSVVQDSRKEYQDEKTKIVDSR